MGSYDQGLAGMVSLQSINEWIGIINSNLGGSNRTAYKRTTVSFGSSAIRIDRDPRSTSNGIQAPDATLKISHTSIDFSQGQIISSEIYTHLALSGENAFFLLAV